MAELVYATDLKSVARNSIRVRLPSRAPTFMIITCTNKLQVGKVYTEKNIPGNPTFDIENIRYYTYSFLVMKEVSKKDYINFLIENYGDDIENFIYHNYYYEISMD